MSTAPVVRVAALVPRDEELLMTRHGPGPAGGFWDVPRVDVRGGETLAEAAVRSVAECCGYTDALCGPFVGWQEDVDRSGDVHGLTMFFEVVLLGDATPDPEGTATATEVRWISTYQIPEMRTCDGLAEFLSDQSIIDTVI